MPRAGRRIEDLDLVDFLPDGARLAGFRIVLPGVPIDGNFACIGQPVGQSELHLENVVDSTDDEIHHRLRRVPDASALPLLRIVGREEVFVEVNEGIVARGEFTEVAE